MEKERLIKIDGTLYHVKAIHEFGSLPEIETDEGEDFILALDSGDAGKAARDYWRDMAENDPTEFTCMVGEKALIAWALGQNYGPGSIGVNSLEEWLDLWIDTPEEHFASYDGVERDVDRVGQLADDLGFTPTVAYRSN